jgi:hypothetical protein
MVASRRTSNPMDPKLVPTTATTMAAVTPISVGTAA